MIRAALVLALLAASCPAQAAPAKPDGLTWRQAGKDMVRPVNVDISAPVAVNGFEAVEYRAFAPGGDDVGVLYRSPDHSTIITLYVYRPSAADARNAVLMTDGAITGGRYGSAVIRRARQIVPFGGVPNGMFRRSYEQLQMSESALGDPMSGPQSSLLMVGQAGDWLIKLRATGPEKDQAKVSAAADALVAAIRLGDRLKVVPLSEDEVSECSEPSGLPPAQRKSIVKAEERAAAGLLVVTGLTPASAAETARPRRLCVVGRTSNSQGLALALRDATKPGGVDMFLFGDQGNAVRVLSDLPDGPMLVLQVQGSALIVGPFDRSPTAAQLLGLTDGTGTAWLGQPLAVARRGAKGVEVQLTGQ